jgi:hypothetical protein
MRKSVSLLAALATAALLSTPAVAAKHKFSCYDFAWQSQEMKDCLANPGKYEHKPMAKAMHKPMHKAMKKEKAKSAKAMKDMKGMKSMPEKKAEPATPTPAPAPEKKS